MTEEDGDDLETLETCRTCGIFYLSSSNCVRNFFASSTDTKMDEIRMQLLSWDIKITETEALPLTICIDCIKEFHRILKFRNSCIDNERQLREYYGNTRCNKNSQVLIKSEPIDLFEDDTPIETSNYTDEFFSLENNCEFVYIDISDDDDVVNDATDAAEYISEHKMIFDTKRTDRKSSSHVNEDMTEMISTDDKGNKDILPKHKSSSQPVSPRSDEDDVIAYPDILARDWPTDLDEDDEIDNEMDTERKETNRNKVETARHRQKSAKRNKCPYCKKVFKLRFLLNRHLNRHLNSNKCTK